MAEHKLTLKATLDSKEVQAELNKLRQMQQSVLGNNGNGTAANGNTSIQNLNSTIGRLNSSIGNLQKSIERMNSQMKSQQSKGNNGNNAPPPNTPFTPSASSRSALRMAKVVVADLIVRDLGNELKQSFMQKGDTRSRMQANSIDALQNTLHGATAGFMVGGPWGAAAGATIGLGTSLYNSFNEDKKFQKDLAKSDLEDFLKALDKDQARIDYFNKLEEKMKWKSDLAKYGKPLSFEEREARVGMNMDAGKYRFEASRYDGDIESLKKLRDTKKDDIEAMVSILRDYAAPNGKVKPQVVIDQVEKDLRDLEDAKNSGAFEAYTKRTPTTNAYAPGGISWKVEQVPSSLNQYVAKKEELQKIKSKYANLISQFDNIGSKDLQEQQARLAEVEAKLADLQEKRLQNLERASELEKQEAQNKKELTKRADATWKVYKQYKEERDNKGDSLSDPKKRYNYYIGQAQDLEKKFSDTVFQATFASTADEAKKLLEEAQNVKSEWDFAKSQADFFGDKHISQLQDKLSMLKAPDMSQVNSLSKYGYMINKSDDQERLKMANEYQKQQVDLTRQIRDRVQEMDTGSKFQ